MGGEGPCIRDVYFLIDCYWPLQTVPVIGSRGGISVIKLEEGYTKALIG
jgi:hypothetical protein